MFNLKNLVFVAVLCLVASTEVLYCHRVHACIPPRRDLAVKVIAGCVYIASAAPTQAAKFWRGSLSLELGSPFVHLHVVGEPALAPALLLLLSSVGASLLSLPLFLLLLSSSASLFSLPLFLLLLSSSADPPLAPALPAPALVVRWYTEIPVPTAVLLAAAARRRVIFLFLRPPPFLFLFATPLLLSRPIVARLVSTRLRFTLNTKKIRASARERSQSAVALLWAQDRRPMGAAFRGASRTRSFLPDYCRQSANLSVNPQQRRPSACARRLTAEIPATLGFAHIACSW
ncbi:hypothetical protein B0H14DRAFT_3434243 [Mycena olivaceomarginata]|nr:hypothetical protein B0H14DRAFT_3434243 [Mycena olivaceomarginata]